MPVPFLLLGAAIVAGGYGVKKGYSAKEGYQRANRINEDAREIFDQASSRLESQRDATATVLAAYGRLKFEVYDRELRRFASAFSRMKNVSLTGIHTGAGLPVQQLAPADLSRIDFTAVDALKVALAGGAAGTTAGFISFGAVGAVASASTGTAISSLAGAAAWNATLAWFGGGSIAAGGFGMQVGAYILGGIIAGPVLAISGLVLDAKAQAAVEDARANRARARESAARMDAAREVAQAIERRTQQLYVLLAALRRAFAPLVGELEAITTFQLDFQKLARHQQVRVALAASLAKTVKTLLDAHVFDGRGMLGPEAAIAAEGAARMLESL